MSGESGRVSKHIQGQRVRPEPVNEKSFVENVAGFINEVVPQTYQNPSHYEGKERITWVKFDHCDINDLSLYRDSIECNGNAPPFLLIIGYSNGVQAWVIPGNGEGVEVFSWRQGPVRTLKVLVSPNISATSVDRFSLKRPILAICDAAGPGPQFHSVSFISLKTGEQLKTIKFKNPVQDIYANKNVIVITFPERLAAFEATTFDDLFTISTCYRCPALDLNPIALGEQWLAFADRRLYSVHQSCGGMVMEGAQSYKSTVIYAAKSITKGLKELGETVASNFMGQKGMVNQPQSPSPATTPGVITVVDTQGIIGTEVDLSGGSCSGVIAHFVAHHGTPIVALEFDPSGMLLATADKLGHNFHLFRIQPHPLSSSQAAVHHLYTLYRGDTTAKVMDISFSLDARWLSVSTHRGTTHVYPITPYGGGIGMRTHKSVCVVNRLSRFHKSAGLEQTPSSGRNSPVLSGSPGVSRFIFEPSPTLAYPNPRYPPYPTPTLLKPLVQLRQPLLQNLIDTIAPGPSPSHSPPVNKSSKVAGLEQIVKVSSIFGTSRGWLAGSPTVPREAKKHGMDSLFVMAYHGNLIEYYLESKPSSNIPSDKITEDSPIELEVHATAQWSLVRESTSHEMRPPLPGDSLLFVSPLNAGLRSASPSQSLDGEDPEEKWMAQVEIYTHAGPPRRLWMGPQFTFKSLPSSGGPFAGDPAVIDACTDPSLTFPYRTSPVSMPGSKPLSNMQVHIEARSLTGSQSPRMSDRFSVDSDPGGETDNVMTRLRSDLADAMLDTPLVPTKGDTSGASTYGKTPESPSMDNEGFDFSDIMDISCDPPGLSSSIGGLSCTSDHHIRPQEEQIQAVTAKLHQVVVTNQPSGANDCVNPFWGSRTPSLEECRALTSSAEELSSTLEGPKCHNSAFAWTPIDVPEPIMQSPPVEKPRPHKKEGGGKGVGEKSDNGVRSKVPHESRGGEAASTKTSWSLIVEAGKSASGAKAITQLVVDSESFPPISSGTSVSKSATTSEDDLWATKEGNRKEKKRRRRKNKQDEEEEFAGPSSLPPPFPPPPPPDPLPATPPPEPLWQSSPPRISPATLDPSPLTPMDAEGDADHFHPAEEFHDPLEEAVEIMIEDEKDCKRGRIHIVDGGGDDDFPPLCSQSHAILLRSVHEGDDLARALEEASSDECIAKQPTSRVDRLNRSKEADEMFPFRESSSDEGEFGDGKVRDVAGGLRRRTNVGSSGNPSEEDETTTSGDDRRGTSESDVTNSPNPRSNSSSSAKKKKKKKKK